MSSKLPCPSCGGEVQLQTYAPYVVCSYCRHILVKQAEQYEDSGEVSGIAEDMSPFQIGTEGLYEGIHFCLVGRLRIAWEDGFWNEWYAYFDDGRFGWIAEAQGALAVLFPTSDVEIRQQLREDLNTTHAWTRILGRTFSIEHTCLTVTDVKKATCIVVEGETPRLSMPGRTYTAIDMMNFDGAIATVEFSVENPKGNIFIGRYVSFSDLRFANLRELEGWSLR